MSVDTVRRRIKAGLLRATRTESGAYVVEIPDAAVGRPPAAGAAVPSSESLGSGPAGQPRASDRLFDRRAHQSIGAQDARALRELLDVERSRIAELSQQVDFLRRQLQETAAEREGLLKIVQTQQEHLGIEQLQRILEAPPSTLVERRPARPRSA